MKKKRLLGFCLAFLLVILPSSFASAAKESFTLILYDPDGNPGGYSFIFYNPVRGAIYFYKINGDYLSYQPNITKIVNGRYKVEYDPEVLGSGDYLMGYGCDNPQSTASRIFKKITLPATTYPIDCRGEPGISKFRLAIKYPEGGYYTQWVYVMFLKGNMGFSNDKDDIYSVQNDAYVTLNNGWHEIYMDSGNYIQKIYVDGNDITVIYEEPSASLSLTVKNSLGPIASAKVWVENIDHSIWYFGVKEAWTDSEGKISFAELFRKGNYSIEACCIPDFHDMHTCPLKSIKNIELLSDEIRTEEVSCDLVNHTVEFTLTDGTDPISNTKVVIARYDGLKKGSDVAHVTDSSGKASFGLYPGEYEIIANANCLTKKERFSVVDSDLQFNYVMSAANKVSVTTTVRNILGPISNANVRLNGVNPMPSYAANTDSGGSTVMDVCPGIYDRKITCQYAGVSSVYTKHNVNINAPTAFDFNCGGAMLNVTIMLDDGSGTLKRYTQGLVLFKLYKDQSTFISSATNNPSLFYVVGGEYEIEPEIDYFGTWYSGVKTPPINVNEGQVQQVFITFNTQPGNESFGQALLPAPPSVEVIASDFRPSLMFLAVAVISMSLLLASFQARKTGGTTK